MARKIDIHPNKEWEREKGLNPKQLEAQRILNGKARHVMLFGGSRSGKTFLMIRNIIIRALKEPDSRHAILRYRFNAVKQSVGYDTIPKVMKLCFENLPYKLDKQDWFFTLPNESQIWLGGLDDKERTEKILGQEFSTLMLNECSQIGWSAREISITRVAQDNKLRQKVYYDCNPPTQSHWTYKLFIQKVNPDTRKALANPEQYDSCLLNPMDNKDNLSPEYLDELKNMSERKMRRFWLGQFLSETEEALWNYAIFDEYRDGAPDEDNKLLPMPPLKRIVIAVDPSGADDDPDKNNDDIGIIVAGLGEDGHAYILDDKTEKCGPSKWGGLVARAYIHHKADLVVGEINYGGAMVEYVVQTALPNAKFKPVTASRGKHIRAEPISALYHKGLVHHMGRLPDLEDELCDFTNVGYIGARSPNRADALIIALTELFPGMVRQTSKAITVEGLGGFDAHTW